MAYEIFLNIEARDLMKLGFDELAKAVKVKVKLESTAGTGTFYLAEKNPRTHPEKLVMKKYDKKSKKHEEFVEKKLK